MKNLVVLIIIFIFSCWSLVSAHHTKKRLGDSASEINRESLQLNKGFRFSEGTCYSVIESLRESQENDSIAIDIFKEEYKITNMRYSQQEWLLNKTYKEIIQFFSFEENKNFYCHSKKFRGLNPVLLVE